jgi:Leucine-rich repeat (LRR) protein
MKVTIFAIILLFFDGQSMGQKVFKCQIDRENHEKCYFNSVEFRVGDDATFGFSSDSNVTAASIETIGFKSSTVETIPTQLFETFENLKYLYINYANFKTIQKSQFENATQLKNLYLNGLEVKTLERNSFPSNLLLIDFCCGALEKVDPGAFEGLAVLDFLVLGRNKIRSIHPETFESLKKLRILYLDYNQLEILHPDTFKALANLRYIKLDSNRLETLPRDLFINNRKLDFIELQENRLSLVPNNLFSHLTNLNKLLLWGNECMNENFEANANSRTLEIQKSMEKCSKFFYKFVKMSDKLDQVLKENQEIKEMISTNNECQSQPAILLDKQELDY